MDKGVLAGQRAVGMEMQDEMIERFVRASESRDAERAGRAERVAQLTEGTALELGLTDEDAAQMSRASKLHHVGDVAVPEQIWSKASGLTPEEVQQVRRHSTIGAELLAQGESPLLRMAEEIANFHHERWDGGGAQGRRGEGVPLGARIVSVADAFEAITHDRPYRAARSQDEALSELQAEAGKQFDPRVVEAFVAFVRR
jgi:putative two-component system response regulator